METILKTQRDAPKDAEGKAIYSITTLNDLLADGQNKAGVGCHTGSGHVLVGSGSRMRGHTKSSCQNSEALTFQKYSKLAQGMLRSIAPKKEKKKTGEVDPAETSGA